MAELNLDPMKEFFAEEIEMLQQEIREADELYDELKEHFDRVKKSSSPGALSFVSKQTTNIISAKTAKSNLVKELINTKKIIVETSLKTKPEENKSGDNEILSALHKMLLENKKEDYIENINKTSQEEIHDDSYYEEQLNNRLAELEASTEKTKEEVKEETIEVTVDSNYQYVVDIEKNIYALDENFNIIDDAPIPPYIIEFREIDDELHAFTQDGEELEIIEFED